MDDREETIDSAIAALNEQLSLPKDFLTILWKEDDWSYVIKLHTLIEMGMSHLILCALGRRSLKI